MRALLVYGSAGQAAADAFLTTCAQRGDQVTVVEIDCRVPQPLRSRGAILRTYESYLSEADLEMIDDMAATFARSWYRSNGTDPTQLSGVSLGRAAELEVFYQAVLLYKNLLCAERALQQDYFDRVMIGSGVSLVPWAWQAIAAAQGRSITHLATQGPVESRGQRSPQAVLQRVWRRLCRRRESQRASGTTGPSASVVLAVREGRATCAAWFSQIRSIPGLAVIPLDTAVTAHEALRAVPGTLRLVARWLHQRRTGHKRQVFRYQQINCWPYWAPRLRALFLKRFLQHHVQAQAMRTWLHKSGACGVVIAWHELTGLDYEVARAAGIPLIVLQDSWLPGEGFPAGYRQFMRCDHVLVWGSISASWARHIPGVQVHVVGNPGAPTLTSTPTGAVDPTARRPTVLLTHQCWGPWTAFHSPLDTNDLWGLVGEAARRLTHVDFLGKIHPLVDDWNHEWPGRAAAIVREVADYGLPNYHVLPLHDSMKRALERTSIVATYYSLTAIEALAQGIPVIVLNATGKRHLFPELVVDGGAPDASTVDEFVAACQRLLASERTAALEPERLTGLMQRIFGTPVDVDAVVTQILAQQQRYER